MRNLDCLSAKQLLSINAPESLFSYSASEARREYRALALHWHPDRSTHPESVPVFTHIVLLFRQAQAKLENGLWDEPVEKAESEKQGIKKFRLRQGTLKTIDYLYLQPFELGTMYIAANHVTFRIDQEFSDLYDNARKQIHGLRFQNESMCLEMASYLPQILDVFETKSASFLQLRKTPDQLLLSQVLGQFLKGIEPIEHIGWIMNVLFHIGCYLEWQGIAHNAISPETFFISPLRHSGMLLGGWWYTARKGDSLRALSDPVMQIIPDDIIRRTRQILAPIWSSSKQPDDVCLVIRQPVLLTAGLFALGSASG